MRWVKTGSLWFHDVSGCGCLSALIPMHEPIDEVFWSPHISVKVFEMHLRDVYLTTIFVLTSVVFHGMTLRIGNNVVDTSPSSIKSDIKGVDYFEFRHVVAEGVQSALDECREQFKWDRWNCPKKLFLDILQKKYLPPNRELAFLRSLMAASIAVSMSQACSQGTSQECACNKNAMRTQETSASILNETSNISKDSSDRSSNYQQVLFLRNDTDLERTLSQFAWRGCDESLDFAFRVSQIYLDTQDTGLEPSSKLVNAHNYRAGRQSVKKISRRICKCHGISGSCQVMTCWTAIPSMSQIGQLLMRQYKSSIKVGALTTDETDIFRLESELKQVKQDKLTFIEASPDYCYENMSLGINGTLGRYCKLVDEKQQTSQDLSKGERDSCEKLCHRCGYKVKQEISMVEKQCDCRFVYCCSVECKRCLIPERMYKCARHGA